MRLPDCHWLLVSALWHRVQYGPERFAEAPSPTTASSIKALRAHDADATASIVHAQYHEGQAVMLDHWPDHPEPVASLAPCRNRRAAAAAAAAAQPAPAPEVDPDKPRK
ncbi:MAG: hypothetical protein U1F49_17840 [Rubrivivax sp.]